MQTTATPPTSAVKSDIKSTPSGIQKNNVPIDIALTERLLTHEQLYFLADRVKQDKMFETYCWQVIERSKQDEKVAIAAANAITVLNVADINFSSKDLSGIRIPGADLSSAQCDQTNFQGADLSNVNFQGAWLRQANWRRANLTNLRFGELPLIQLTEGCISIQYSPNGRWLAVTSGQDIIVYDAHSRQCIQKLTGHTNNVFSVAWDHESKRLASGSVDETVRLWEASSGKELRVLQRAYGGCE